MGVHDPGPFETQIAEHFGHGFGPLGGKDPGHLALDQGRVRKRSENIKNRAGGELDPRPRHIGHGAVLHGCLIKKNAMVGMNAVVMDGAVIGENSFVAAMAFVKAGMEVPANVVVAGCPAKIIKELNDKEIGWKSEGTRIYQHLASRHALTGIECEPLTEVEPNRKRVPLTDHAPKHQS